MSTGAGELHRTIPGYVPTPLVESPPLAEELGVARVLIKDESRRLGLGAFKILGTSWAIYQAVSQAYGIDGPGSLDVLRATIAERDPVLLVTATDGNHGRAVARVAALLGLSARVFVPRAAGSAAIGRLQGENVELTIVEGSYDATVAEAIAATDVHPHALLVQDTAWEGYEQFPAWTAEGYSTLFEELDAQLDGAPGLVAIPVGVGSLAHAAVAHYRARELAAPPALLSVEPDTAACVVLSLQRQRLTAIETGETLMNGLNCGTPSTIAWPLLTAGLDAAIAVSDNEAAQAITDLAAAGVTSGPSGSSSLAGARAALTGDGSQQRRDELAITADSTVVLISTEGFEDGGHDG